jgi:hypothetical protein
MVPSLRPEVIAIWAACQAKSQMRALHRQFPGLLELEANNGARLNCFHDKKISSSLGETAWANCALSFR